MKRQLTTILLTIIAVTAMAIPAKRGQWKTITLADGTQVRAELRGDEHMHFLQDAEGNKYVRSNSGTYVTADIEAMQAKADKRRAMASAQRAKRAAAKKVGTRKTYEGAQKGLIILVEFSEQSFADGHNQALYNRIANEENFTSSEGFVGSVADYFKAQSAGKFTLSFDVVGPVKLANAAAYYGSNDASGDDEHATDMVIEACEAADAYVNYADYDWDGDGEVDQVFVLYCGAGEANGGAEETIWPHEWTLSSAAYYGMADGPITLDGVKIDTYACSGELQPDDYDYDYTAGEITEVYSWKIDGIGTICHEFSHCLGYPDMYDTRTNGSNYGMYTWDLMDYGSYNADGFRPSGYTSYEKWWAGWIEPIELNEDAVDVEAMKPLAADGDAYVIYNDSKRSDGIEGEYYLLENRQKVGWDAAQYSEGLLVLHVDYDEDVWASNKVNNTTSHQRCTVFHASNSEDDGPYGDPYPYDGNNKLTNTSTPKASLYNNNTDGKKLMNKSVTDITQNSDGTISFKYAGTSSGSTDPTPTGDYLFYESFNECAGTGGNDGSWNGSIAAGAMKSSSSESDTDNVGWSTTNAYKGYQCAKFGTGSANGSATSPSFTVNGTATLTFKAGAWDAGKDGTTLNLSVSSGTISPTSVTMAKGAWGSYTATITATGSTKVTFAAQKGRFFLDEVLAVDPTATGIKGISITERPADNRIYSIDGRYVGTDMNILRPGIYIVGGRKVVR